MVLPPTGAEGAHDLEAAPALVVGPGRWGVQVQHPATVVTDHDIDSVGMTDHLQVHLPRGVPGGVGQQLVNDEGDVVEQAPSRVGGAGTPVLEQV
jgi:hypothetical protein